MGWHRGQQGYRKGRHGHQPGRAGKQRQKDDRQEQLDQKDHLLAVEKNLGEGVDWVCDEAEQDGCETCLAGRGDSGKAAQVRSASQGRHNDLIDQDEIGQAADQHQSAEPALTFDPQDVQADRSGRKRNLFFGERGENQKSHEQPSAIFFQEVQAEKQQRA